MNIYKISQYERRGYDTYDSAVVVAKSADEARRIHPDGILNPFWHDGIGGWVVEAYDGSVNRSSQRGWAEHIDQVNVLMIGRAAPGISKGVKVASFNGG